MRLSTCILACALPLLAPPAARADCAEDFRATNTRRADASRFTIRTDAQVIDQQGVVRRTLSSSSQFDLADGVRMKTSGLSTQPDFVIVGDQGWSLKDGAWTPMPAAQVRAALGALSAASYFHDAGISNIDCAADAQFEGERRAAFAYDQELNGLAMTVVAYFDAATRAPVASVASAKVQDMTVRIVTRLALDPTIRIEPPR